MPTTVPNASFGVFWEKNKDFKITMATIFRIKDKVLNTRLDLTNNLMLVSAVIINCIVI